MNIRVQPDRDRGVLHSPELEVIVSADSGEAVAVRALPGAWTPRAIDRLSMAASSSEDTLWRLAADRDRRRAALFCAARAGWKGRVHVPIMAASAEDSDVCSMALVADARAAGIKPDRIVLELSEAEEVDDIAKLALATGLWRSLGFRTATRHFGAGLSGMSMLLRLEPEWVCMDGDWARRVSIDPGTRIIVAGVARTCEDLGCEVIADGVISARLSENLVDLGIRLQSGPLFAATTEALFTAK